MNAGANSDGYGGASWDEDSIRFGEILSLLLRHKWIIVVTALLSSLATFAWICTSRPVYVAQATLVLADAAALTTLTNGGLVVGSFIKVNAQEYMQVVGIATAAQTNQQTKEGSHQLRWSETARQKPATKRAGQATATNKAGPEPATSDAPRGYEEQRVNTI